MPTHQDLPTGNKSILDQPGPSFRQSSLSQDQNMMAALAYFGFIITGVFLLLTEKNNQFIRFHAMQSVIFSAGLFLVFAGVNFMVRIPFFGAFINMLVIPILTLSAFGFWAAAIYKAFQGERYELPFIGPIARRQMRRF